MKCCRNSRRIRKNVPPFCHSDRSVAERRNPPRWRKNRHKVKLATWEDSSTRIRFLGMTWRGVVPFNRTDYIRNGASPWPGLGGGRLPPLHCVVPLRPLFLQCFTPPRGASSVSATPSQLPRRGRSCVVPLNRTGSIRDVAGGRLPPLHARWRVVPFNQRIQNRTRPSPKTVNCQL